MARRNLGDLLSVAEQQPEPETDTQQEPPAIEDAGEAPKPALVASTPDASPAPAPSPAATRTRRPTAVPDAREGAGSDASVPRYLALTRKEARLTDAQLAGLSALTRRINRARQGRGERITDNTLIRVAVDLLLERSDQITGLDEDQLRHSVGL
jgi:hypothetical protein